MVIEEGNVNGEIEATSQNQNQNAQQADDVHHNHPLYIHLLDTQDYKHKKKGGHSNTYANSVITTGNQSLETQGYPQSQYPPQNNNDLQLSQHNMIPSMLPFTPDQYAQILNLLDNGKGKGKMIDAIANTTKFDTAGPSSTSGTLKCEGDWDW